MRNRNKCSAVKFGFFVALLLAGGCGGIENQKINLDNEKSNPLIIPPIDKTGNSKLISSAESDVAKTTEKKAKESSEISEFE